jgi:hypothetical protein
VTSWSFLIWIQYYSDTPLSIDTPLTILMLLLFNTVAASVTMLGSASPGSSHNVQVSGLSSGTLKFVQLISPQGKVVASYCQNQPMSTCSAGHCSECSVDIPQTVGRHTIKVSFTQCVKLGLEVCADRLESEPLDIGSSALADSPEPTSSADSRSPNPTEPVTDTTGKQENKSGTEGKSDPQTKDQSGKSSPSTAANGQSGKSSPNTANGKSDTNSDRKNNQVKANNPDSFTAILVGSVIAGFILALAVGAFLLRKAKQSNFKKQTATLDLPTSAPSTVQLARHPTIKSTVSPSIGSSIPSSKTPSPVSSNGDYPHVTYQQQPGVIHPVSRVPGHANSTQMNHTAAGYTIGSQQFVQQHQNNVNSAQHPVNGPITDRRRQSITRRPHLQVLQNPQDNIREQIQSPPDQHEYTIQWQRDEPEPDRK